MCAIAQDMSWVPRSTHLNNRLQLPGVLERVLDDLTASSQDILLSSCKLLLLLREVYTAVLGDPATRMRKLNNGAFRVEEEQVLGV